VPNEVDVILAADCAYFEPSFPLLLGTLQRFLGTRTVLWFCYKKRRKADKDMVRMLEKAFDVQEVKGDWKRDGVWLLMIKQRKAVPKKVART